MDQFTANKSRVMVDGQAVATADATGYPTFPSGPTNGIVQFKGDFLGAGIAGITWLMADLDTFTQADCTIQSSADGENWVLLKAFTQKSADGSETIWLLDTDPKALRFLRALIDMTGTPGTSTHTVTVHYNQIGPRGNLADGIVDRKV